MDILQDTLFSCGTRALKNCLNQLGIIVSEKRLRDLCNTTKEKGTSLRGLVKGIQAFNLGYLIFLSEDVNWFMLNFFRALHQKHVGILLTESTEHWLAIVKNTKRGVKVIDSAKETGGVRYYPKETIKEYAFNFDKLKKKSYYCFLELWKND